MIEPIGKPERSTQRRVAGLFTEQLGWRHPGDWSDRVNHCIEEAPLTAFLQRSGYGPAQISAALHRLRDAASTHGRGLYVKRTGRCTTCCDTAWR